MSARTISAPEQPRAVLRPAWLRPAALVLALAAHVSLLVVVRSESKDISPLDALEVSLVARGAHLAAMRENGLALRQAGETRIVRPRLTDDARQLGPQDFIILTLKAHAIAPAIEAMKKAGATALSVDAGKALMIDGPAIVTAADAAGIAIVGRAR